MFISPINNSNNNTNFKELYFTKGSPLFRNTYLAITGELKKSSKGILYIEDANVSETIKGRFMQSPAIKKLSEEFDVFVQYGNVVRNGAFRVSNIVAAFVQWGNDSNQNARKIYFLSEEADASKAKKHFFNGLNRFYIDKSKKYNGNTFSFKG